MPTLVDTYGVSKLEPFMNPEHAREFNVKLAASTNYLKGTWLGEVTATPGIFKPYASGNSDGSQVARVLLQYDCVTDASSNITFTATAGQNTGQSGQLAKVAPVYYAGTFLIADLVGHDATAISSSGARVPELGIIRLG